ncbi:hypothetical protein D0N36_01465 [Hymenobacter lapidiphilus]|uniref:CBM20 domain-containing protein n=1 Tax=Hymenobacter sp. CCM 8763 TaxID=2303334 RepID=UPI000E35676C|nr:CBM20 domain-containing protein [Hymenobacter sp. CCM 8763]RFP66780.1 hypothetical protein D0N36_01465 [Hymenobacter sp. CCM 8763]
MILRFTLPYRTEPGQRLVVCGSLPALGQWAPEAALALHYDAASGHWNRELEVSADQLAGATYKYLLLDERDGGRHWEWGPNRELPTAVAPFGRLVLADWWRAPAQPENELFTAAFTEALFRRPAPAAPAAPGCGRPGRALPAGSPAR